jgi:hypothetical protein
LSASAIGARYSSVASSRQAESEPAGVVRLRGAAQLARTADRVRAGGEQRLQRRRHSGDAGDPRRRPEVEDTLAAANAERRPGRRRGRGR